MFKLLDIIEKLLNGDGQIYVACDRITNVELSFLKNALNAKVTRTPDDEYLIVCYWKFEGN